MNNKRIPSWIIALLILISAYILMRFVVRLPIPLVNFYMLFFLVGTIIHITLDERRIEELKVILNFIAGKEVSRTRDIILAGIIIVISSTVAYGVYNNVKISYKPPARIFTPHPTPPGWVVGFKIPEWIGGEDPARWDKGHIEEGKRLYEDNCAYCHGKEADGKGREAKALRYPAPPTNFKDPATIRMIQLSYAYWRVRDGGIHDKQFMSAMPGWGEEMDDDEIWKTIMYMYYKAGVKPRTW